jgi:hypothetical protein
MVIFLILASVALTVGLGPTISLFITMFQRAFRGKVGKRSGKAIGPAKRLGAQP